MGRILSECHSYQETLRRLPDEPETPISDQLALHLDECTHCRRLFDTARVPLVPASFENLSTDSRKRILQVLAEARSPSRRWMLAVSVVAVLGVLGLASASLVYEFKFRDQDRPITVDLVQDHVRYLTHPDRRSDADLAQLKAYLDEYIDFPLELPEIPTISLTGVRHCSLVGRRAALVFYDTPMGAASYFIVAADGLQMPGSRCADHARLFCAASYGYRIVSWEEAGLLHAVVGSNEAVLLQMARVCTDKMGPLSNEEGGS